MAVHIQRAILIARKASVKLICDWWFNDNCLQIEGQKLVSSQGTILTECYHFFFPKVQQKIFHLFCLFFDLTILCALTSCVGLRVFLPESLGDTKFRLRQSGYAGKKYWGSSSAHMLPPWCTLPETVPLVPRPAIGTITHPLLSYSKGPTRMVHAM